MGRWRVVVLLAACLYLVTGCGGNLPRYSVQDLAGMPEGRLFAPGSEVILGLGMQSTVGPGRPYPANTGSQLGTAGTAAEVEAFYQRELAQRGWVPYSGANFRTSDGAIRITRWRKGDLGFQLSFFDTAVKDRERRAAGKTTYPTYYEILLTEIYP